MPNYNQLTSACNCRLYLSPVFGACIWRLLFWSDIGPKKLEPPLPPAVGPKNTSPQHPHPGPISDQLFWSDIGPALPQTPKHHFSRHSFGVTWAPRLVRHRTRPAPGLDRPSITSARNWGLYPAPFLIVPATGARFSGPISDQQLLLPYRTS